jgi:hypothetical protein
MTTRRQAVVPAGTPQPAAADTMRELFEGRGAAFVTKHQKDVLLAGILRGALGIHVRRADVDTDAYSTFIGAPVELKAQVDTARRKAEAAFVADPETRIAIANEGTFSTLDLRPRTVVNREVVVFIDRDLDLEVVGEDRASTYANAERHLAHSVTSVLSFARSVGFPSQGLVLRSISTAEAAIVADFPTELALGEAASKLLALGEPIMVQTDLRAHKNPLRREAIVRACVDLVRRLLTSCPACRLPGFGPQWPPPESTGERGSFDLLPYSRKLAECPSCRFILAISEHDN